MKKTLLLCLAAICMICQPALAQNDAKAKAILDATTKKINGLKSLKANFALSLTGGKGKVNDSRKGTIALKGQKYRVVLSGQEIICDNKTIWTYTKDAQEVQISNYNPAEHTMSPAKLFTNFYDKEYGYSYKGERKEQGKNCDVVELTPNDRSKSFQKIELMVDKSTSLIVGGNIWEKNGNKYQYAITGFMANANVPDSDFTWDPKAHPGVEVVDLR
jgi:outer membrane lipoprotein carrier protein